MKKITPKKLKSLMSKNIFYSPLSCDMGTGYEFRLLRPNTNDVIKRMRYLDIFDISEYTDDDINTLSAGDVSQYYEEFKSNILQYGRERFHELCAPIILHVLNLELI
jgi:hypothetical protein